MECHELATMIFPQQVTEGQLIKKGLSCGKLIAHAGAKILARTKSVTGWRRYCRNLI
jgi:hypothetical protein